MLSPATVGLIVKSGRPALKLLLLGVAGIAVLLAFVLMLVNTIVNTMTLQQQMLASCTTAAGPDGPMPQLVPGTGGRLQVNVATWNTLAFNSTARIVAGLRAVGRTADVIGVQELTPESRRHHVQRALRGTFGISKGNNAVRILWKRSRFLLLAQGSEEVFGVRRVEGGVSGTSVGPKSIQWVQLRDRHTGAVFFVANHHIVPTIDRRGHPDRRRPTRLVLYRKQMDAMLKLVDRLRPHGPVIITGDFNVAARADARVRHPSFPHQLMGSRGLASNWRQLGFAAGPTQGSRHIDYVWTTAATARATAQTLLPKHGSDHSPLVVAISGGSGASAAATSKATQLPAIDGLSNTQVKVAAGLYAAAVTVGGELGWSASKTEHAALVLLATAMQESTMGAAAGIDRPNGDGDAGVLQQRTLPGWYGTVAEVNDPATAARLFLLGKQVTAADVAAARRNGNRPAGPDGYRIPGLNQIRRFQDLPVTVAAQRVQRSAFPDAYARWEPLVRRAVQALRGLAGEAMSSTAGCDIDDAAPSAGLGGCDPTGLAAEQSLTPDALLALRCTAGRYPKITTFYGKNNDQMDHGSGRAVDIMISSAFPDHRSADAQAYGWQIAKWLRANADALGVHYVIFAARIWNADRDGEGWRPYGSITGSNNDTSLHYDHVHVSVWGNRGTGLGNRQSSHVPAGQWTMPLPAGSYRVGCAYGCYSGHTGQDFPVPGGTDLLSSNDGIVIRSEALRTSGGGYRSYGNLVVVAVKGNPAMTVWYAHLTRRDVQVGDPVRAGQRIGTTGYTGNVRPRGPGGAHLHYEIRVDGAPTNPMTILTSKGVTS